MNKVKLSPLQLLQNETGTSGESNTSFVLISLDIPKTKYVKELLSKIPLVSQVIDVRGMYDLVIKMESESNNAIKDAVVHQIRHMKGVRACIPLFGFNIKHSISKKDKDRR